MKKALLITILMTMSFFGFSQDWFGFNRYKDDNARIKASGNYPKVVFMGNSITENWAYYHPNFFSDNNFCGRGISGQTSSQMLVRFTADVVELQLYPNPASTTVTISGVQDDVQLIDATGRTIRTIRYTGNQAITINVSTLANGVYFLKTGTHYSSFIIQQ